MLDEDKLPKTEEDILEEGLVPTTRELNTLDFVVLNGSIYIIYKKQMEIYLMIIYYEPEIASPTTVT